MSTSVDNRSSTRVFFELLYKLQIIASGFLVYKFAHVEIHPDEYTAFKQHLSKKKLLYKTCFEIVQVSIQQQLARFFFKEGNYMELPDSMTPHWNVYWKFIFWMLRAEVLVQRSLFMIWTRITPGNPSMHGIRYICLLLVDFCGKSR